jgi:hypothetical protein
MPKLMYPFEPYNSTTISVSDMRGLSPTVPELVVSAGIFQDKSRI